MTPFALRARIVSRSATSLMQSWGPRCLVLAVICVCVLCASTVASSVGDVQPNAAPPDSGATENPGVPVQIDGRAVLLVYAPVAGITPEERAQGIQQRIIALGRRKLLNYESIHTEDRGAWAEILAGTDRIMAVTEADARAAERPRTQLAAEYTEIIRMVVLQYRKDHTWRHFLTGILYTTIATVCLVALLMVLFTIKRKAGGKIEQWLLHRKLPPSVSFVFRLRHYMGRPFVSIMYGVFWVMILSLLHTYVTVVLRFFPSTRYLSFQITQWLFSEFAAFGKAIIGYLPNLFLVIFISLATSYCIRLNRYIFEEIGQGKLAIRGFYPEWAEPTAKLVRFLILAAAAIVVFPYLPGSQSPAFKGISVFLGVLLSLGSTSAVAHVVAGTILTYMRAFRVGDFVRIGSDTGEVVEKTLLVTRICTQKKEVVTIPNGTVLGGVVINYSAEARQKGVIFHTTVTIGYNAPWRQVHQLLIAAALTTDGVLREPAPFVLQTALNDFYVAYELNAYTATPTNMQVVYSTLHQNIQDQFNHAGVEINSPHYAALRDGNRTTIPEAYLSSDYRNPVFEFHEENHSQVIQREEQQREEERTVQK